MLTLAAIIFEFFGNQIDFCAGIDEMESPNQFCVGDVQIILSSPRALSKFIAIPLSCRSLSNVEMRRCFWQPLMPTEAMNSGFLSGSVAWGCQRSLTCRHLLTQAFFPLLAYELIRMHDGMSTTVDGCLWGLRFVLKRMRTMWRWP